MSKLRVGDIVEVRITATWFDGANGISATFVDDPPYSVGFRIQAEEMLPEYIDNLTHGQVIKVRLSEILYGCSFFSTIIEEETEEQRKTRVNKIKRILKEKEKDAEDKRWKRGKYSPKPQPQQNVYRSRNDWEEERRIEEQIREDAWEYNENH